MLRFLTLVACAGLLAAGVPARAGHNVQFNFPGGVYIEEGRDRIQVRFSEDGRTVKFEARGDFELTTDEADLARLEPEGLFRIEERRRGRTERRFVARGTAGGGIAREFELGGERQEMTAEDRAWLAEAIEAVLSRTTFAAASHVEHLLAEGGPERALGAIAAMESDHVQFVHYRELLERRAGEGETARLAVQRAGESIGSDHERRLLVAAAMEHGPCERELPLACARTCDKIGSDHERRLALQAILDASDPDPAVSEAIATSAQGIGSDHERALVLLGLLQHHPMSTAEAPAFFEATSGIGSDHERARVLREVLTRPNLEPEILLGLLESARGIGSDHERGGVLVELATSQTVEGKVRREYVETSREIGSDHWRRRALEAVGEPSARSDG